jgi:phage shock protein A
VVANLTVFSW